MKARYLLETLVGPSPELIDRIARIIERSPNYQEANQELAQFGIKYDPDDVTLKLTGAFGGALGGEVRLNPKFFGNRWIDLRMVLAHELTHQEQLRRAKSDGADPEEIAARKLARYSDEKGNVDLDQYLRDPLEMQALARNAIDKAVQQGEDPKRLMRSGQLKNRAPLLPRDTNRFGKYAYQMLGQR